MQQNQRSEEFRKSAVQKVLLRGAKTVSEICDELSISTPTFYEWRRKYANAEGMKTKERRPQDFTPIEKFKAVMDFEALAEESRGEFLRRHGLHTDHIAAWKKTMELSLVTGFGMPTPATKVELLQLRSENKELKKDLHRKDRALAETTALLVLKKKADLIWGTGENE